MGEIKSTLDLVMEKTKHLSQSAEEKTAQRRKDIENRLRGMLQKYQDKVISLEHLQRDYEGLNAEFNLPDHTFLAGQVMDRLDPDGDNRALLEVLEHCCNLDCRGLADLIQHHQVKVQTAAQRRMKALKASLARNFNISGPAVVPNLEADDQWRREAQGLRAEFEGTISREQSDLLG
jgi:hypothetical protein